MSSAPPRPGGCSRATPVRASADTRPDGRMRSTGRRPRAALGVDHDVVPRSPQRFQPSDSSMSSPETTSQPRGNSIAWLARSSGRWDRQRRMLAHCRGERPARANRWTRRGQWARRLASTGALRQTSPRAGPDDPVPARARRDGVPLACRAPGLHARSWRVTRGRLLCFPHVTWSSPPEPRSEPRRTGPEELRSTPLRDILDVQVRRRRD